MVAEVVGIVLKMFRFRAAEVHYKLHNHPHKEAT
jgi:hypothetical protein